MAKVLLSHSYFLYLDPKQERGGNAYPPLATLYAASLLREHGHRLSLFDAMLASSPRELSSVLKKENPQILVIYDDGFNYLTKMCLTNMREAAFEMISIAKSYGCQVII
ncbi:MAG: radical SAM protein, partial [Cytophagales bacterium]|nr:radical SAM protein [Cytophagales bacterium]